MVAFFSCICVTFGSSFILGFYLRKLLEAWVKGDLFVQGLGIGVGTWAPSTNLQFLDYPGRPKGTEFWLQACPVASYVQVGQWDVLSLSTTSYSRQVPVGCVFSAFALSLSIGTTLLLCWGGGPCHALPTCHRPGGRRRKKFKVTMSEVPWSLGQQPSGHPLPPCCLWACCLCSSLLLASEAPCP